MCLFGKSFLRRFISVMSKEMPNATFNNSTFGFRLTHWRNEAHRRPGCQAVPNHDLDQVQRPEPSKYAGSMAGGGAQGIHAADGQPGDEREPALRSNQFQAQRGGSIWWRYTRPILR